MAMSSQPQSSQSGQLTSDDLQEVFEALYSISSMYINLGLRLKVHRNRIRAIEMQYTDPYDRLREILDYRLNQLPPLTWHDIVRVLQSPTVQQHDLARTIESQYIAASQSPASVSQQASAESSHAAIHTSGAQPSTHAPPQPPLHTVAAASVPLTHTPIALPQPPVYNTGQPLQLIRPPFLTQLSLHPNTVAPNPAYIHHQPCYHQQYPQPQPPSQYVPPTVRESSSQQANYFPSQFQPTYPSQHSFPMQQNSFTHFPIPQPATLPLNPRFPSGVGDGEAHLPANAAASSVRHPAPQPANLPFQSQGVQRTLTQPQFAGIPSTTATDHFQNPTHITLTDTAIAPHHPAISPPQHNPADHTDMHTSSSNIHRQTVHVNIGPISPPMQSQSPSLHSDPPQAKRPRHDTSVAQLSEPLPPQDSVTSQHDALYPPEFIKYIKDIYRRSIVGDCKDTKWPPTASEVFIQLAILDRKTVTSKEADAYTEAMVKDGNVDVILQKKTPIEMNDVARDVEENQIIVVEGAPGVGKSTFAWEFCRRWERGEIVQQYQLVLLLRLRDEGMSTAKTLDDLIYHPSETVCLSVLRDLKAFLGRSALIILEGFDELPKACRSRSSIFLKLISGSILLHATVLITSRHWATRIIHKTNRDRIAQHIEILGFTELQIKNYIQSVFVEKGKDPDEIAKKHIDETVAYIEKYPQIKACMYIPLNSAIVVNIFQESKAGRCIIPETLTGLYYAVTQTLLLRYLYGHPEYGQEDWVVRDIKTDLPKEVFTKLLNICHEAYKGICTVEEDRVQLIFSNLCPDFETLGFMQSVPQLYTTQGAVMSHNFLHLTVQEFLAALHISFMSPEQQLLHLKRHKEGKLKVVLRFLAGLTKLENISLDQIRGLFGKPLQENESSQGKYCTRMTPDISVGVHHTNWMFETQSTEIIKTLLENGMVEFVCEKGMVPLEYYCVGYCIAHSQCNWCLTFAEDMEDEKLEMFLTEINKTGGGTEYRVAVKIDQPMSSETLNTLFAALGPWLEELYLKLADNGSSLSLTNLPALHILELGMCSKSTLNLSSDFPLQSLESLTINAGNGGNTLGLKSCEAIAKFLSSSTSLKEVYFNLSEGKQWSVGSMGMVAITKGMSDNMALPLRSLEIECNCTFRNTAAKSLGQFIRNSTALKYIRMYNIQFIGCGLIELTEALLHCSSLQEKKLEKLLLHRIESDDEVTKLIQMFHDHPDMLQCIDWKTHLNTFQRTCYNTKARVFAIAIHHNLIEIEENLDLNKISISDAGAIALAQALHHNSTLEKLYLNNTNISDVGATDLAQALHHNSTLKGLYLYHNNISDVGATDLAQALHHNSTLKELDLSKNNISNVGATDLAQALHHNSTLERLELHGNDGIGEEGTRQLVQALTVNTSIKLWLPWRCEEYASQCMENDAVKPFEVLKKYFVKTRVQFI